MKLILTINFLEKQNQILLEANFDHIENLGGLKYFCDTFDEVKQYLKNRDSF